MRRWVVVLSALSVSLGAATAVAGSASAGNDNDPYTLSDGHAQAGPAGGIVPARDAHTTRPHGGSSPNLTWHGGAVQTVATTVYPVFWGTSWSNSSDVVDGMNSFYAGVGGTTYMKTNSEYTSGGGTAPKYAGTPVNTSVSLGSSDYYDTTSAPTSSPTTTAVADAVARALGTTPPVAHAYYPVYADTSRRHASFCAWHSYATINGVQVQIAFFWNLTNDSGCNNNDPYAYHSQNIDSLGNVSGHELSEMVTDPIVNAWYDAQGSENADKCAWTFNGPETFSNGTSWYIQGNWSNNAYNNKVGYANGGCITSTP